MPRKFKRLALPDQYVSLVGTHEWLLDKFGLTAPHVIEQIRQMV
jgi:transketolase C-terminal domain/subunit